MTRGLFEKRLERDLNSVRKKVRRMGKAVSTAVGDATKAVIVSDHQLATDTILGDMPINRLARKLDERCHSFIALHLPSAGHLRFVSSAMRLSKTLERIGDYAETIARAAVHLTVPPPEAVGRDIEMLGRHAVEILERALDAYDKGDVVLAKGTRADVGQYGPTFDKVFTHLIDAGEKRQHPIEDLFGLEAICNRLERIIHQGKNISEQTIFAVTGERKEAKTFDFLFVDGEGRGASMLAACAARRAYAESGSFKSACWTNVTEPSEAYLAYANSKGLGLNDEVPCLFEDARSHLSDYDIIVDLSGNVRDHIRKIPFHTTLLRWPLEFTDDPEAVHKQLVHRMGDLMDILRGDEDE